ncbi:hypothetical protein TYRP_005050 [Tyrophagus putrescentiae]|nr:hypothetical protein TYRP_005050 [Tyrophagus putrescentiae]
MNEEANDADEVVFIEAAPEDDDFSDYEANENENPEAVQAMIGGPSWVFPDLHASVSGGTSDQQQQQQLQSQSSSPAIDLTASTCQPSTSRGSLPRVLDPPDVSLLSSPVANSTSSTSSSNQQQPNTIDLCSSVRQSYHGFASKNGNYSATSSPPSNSAGSSSSSSGASSLSTNFSGLILSNTSSTSVSSSANGALNGKGVNRSNADNNKDNFADYNFPSTSSAIFSNSNAPKQLNSMEQEIRTLEEEKDQLAQQLARKDDELEEMRQSLSSMRLSSNGAAAAAAPAANSSASTEGAIVQRIEDLFERMSSNLQNTLASFERRIESLESRQLHASNGASSSLHSPGSSPQQLAQLMAEYQRRIGENQRQEMCSLFRNILTSAVGEIDSFSSSASSSSSSSAPTTTTNSESLLQQRQNGKFKSNLNGL